MDDATLRWLAGYRFTGDVWGYGEGECFFPGSPLLVVEGTFAEAVRARDARPVDPQPRLRDRGRREPDARRRPGPALPRDGVAAHPRGGGGGGRPGRVRRRVRGDEQPRGRPPLRRSRTIGTAAHAFTLLHDDERAAFEAQVAALGTGTTLLVDTYDVRQGVRTAVEVAGTGLGAVRLDSGDLLEQAHAVRAQLDRLGAFGTRIIGDQRSRRVRDRGAGRGTGRRLRRRHLAGHRQRGADGGPGLQAGGPARTPSGELVGVAKRSADKVSIGGRKWALRRRGPDGVAQAEIVGIGHDPADDGDDRRLLVQLVEDGEIVGGESLEAARARHSASLAELPATGRQLSRGEPAIPTIMEPDPAR